MAYIAAIHKSSSVRHALSVKLLSEDAPGLVVAKANRLEIWQLADEQLTRIHTSIVFGNICMLEALQPRDSPTQILFVGTDRFRYFTARWDAQSRRLETVEDFQDLGERFVRDATTRNKCLVDPTGRFMAMLLWSGVLSVTRLQRRKGTTMCLEWLEQARISELYIKAATFLHSETGHPRIAFLYQTRPNMPESKLVTYRLCSDDSDSVVSKFDPYKDRDISMDVADPGAAMLIPVERVEEEKRHNFRNPVSARAHLGGLIVVGESRLLYIDDVTKAKFEASLTTPLIFVAWAAYDATHYFLADDYGGLHLLTIMVEGVVVKELVVSYIGKSSRASELVYLGNGMLFVGSHYGDSQLLKVDFGAEKMVDPVQTLPNIAPILDFTVMDMGNREAGDDSQLGNEYSSGQARIVTGSGAHKDGTLRSVRSGVGVEDVGVIADLGDIRGLFSLRSPRGVSTGVDDTLVASFVTETRVFRFDEAGDVEEVEQFQGLELSLPTILASNLAGGRVLQVNEAGVYVIDQDGGVTINSWSPPEGKTITTASANSRWVLLSVEGRTLVSLSLDGELRVGAQRETDAGDQIACIHASPHLLEIGAVGFWSTGTVSLVDLPHLEAIHTEKLRRTDDDAIVPRDIVLASVLPPRIAGPTLFVAMDDGEVVTFAVSRSGRGLSGRKSVVLGTRQARFHVLPQEGEEDSGREDEGEGKGKGRVNGHNNRVCSIFVTSEHSSLIYGSESRIVYSAVTAESATYVCLFDSAAFPDSLAMATESTFKIAKIDKQRQSHIQSLDMGENVRTIAYSSGEKAFGLGCIKRELVKGVEMASSTFRLVDEVIFQRLGRPFELEAGELVECVVRARLPDSYGDAAERFVVGTRALLADSDHRLSASSPDSKGRIIVFGVDEDRSPYQILSHPVKSGCRRLAVMDDMIVAALTKTVVIARYEELSTTSGRLVKLASYQCSSYAIDLAVEGRLVAVADLMKSVALVEFVTPSEEEAGGGQAEGRGKDGGNSKKGKNNRRGKQPSAATPASQPQEPRLVEVCRHFQSAWATAVCHVEGDSWLEADADGNLVVLRRNAAGLTLEDRKRMEVTSELNLSESVNRIQKITVETGPKAPIIPRAFLSTIEGSIYLFGTIAPRAQDLLLRFQDNLARRVVELGNIPFASWRSFRNAEREGEEPLRFLDGEFLERFLDMDEETQREVCDGLGPSVEDMRDMVEELKSMH